jgi:2-succinyl-6-hydroxy-2,4-cyclohexadiene-1-carboxylate synthase
MAETRAETRVETQVKTRVETIEIQGFPHRYELSAPTDSQTVLVFVHGWLLSRAYWQPLIEQLSAVHQCLIYDLRGFGESHQPNLSPSSEQYGLEAYAEDLCLLLRQLNIQTAWLIGHSLGGSIALWAADQAPDLIAGVICVNSGGGIYLKEEFERFRTAGQFLIRFRPLWLSRLPLLALPLSRLNVAQPLPWRWGQQRLKDLVLAEPEAALGALLESTTEAEVHRLPQVVARLQQPVHFIAGANDSMMEPKYVHHLASFHPSFECCGNNVSEIANCGHLSMVEQPEALAREIRAILAQYSA